MIGGEGDSLSCAFDESSPSCGSMVIDGESEGGESSGEVYLCDVHLRGPQHVLACACLSEPGGVSHLLMSRPGQQHSSPCSLTPSC